MRCVSILLPILSILTNTNGSIDDAGIFLVLINKKKREIHLGTRSKATGSDKVMFVKLRSVKKDIEIFPHGRLTLICYARDM